MKLLSTSLNFIRAHLLITALVAGVIIGALITAGILESTSEPVAEEEKLPLVAVATIAELTGGSINLPLIGIVESTAEANLQTQRSSIVVQVNYGLGDAVPAGAAIAILANQSEQAAVAQAQAALQSAQASYAQIQTRLERTSETTQEEVMRAYRDAYIAADDAVQNKTEPFFLNDRTAYPVFLLPTGEREDIEENRFEASNRLRTWERNLEEISAASDIRPYLAQARSDLQFIENFLTAVASPVNRQEFNAESYSITDTERTALASARSTISAKLSALIAVNNALQQNTQSSATGLTSEQEAERAVAEASVAQARANLDAARAALEETIVRSPISGFINTLEVKVGDSVAGFAPVATVINPAALEILTYIAPADRSLVAVGDTVILGEAGEGKVTRIAPGVSAQTGKIEVRIAPESSALNLTAGDSVTISLLQASEQTQNTGGTVTLPLTAIKFKTDSAVIFTVDESNRLVEHTVTVGQVLGNRVTVGTDIPLDTEIVIDARGLFEGDAVDTVSDESSS